MKLAQIAVGLGTGFVTLTLLMGGTAQAATCTWQSTASSAWNVAANWSCGSIPTATDDVVFPGGASLQNTITNDVIGGMAVHSISVTGGAYGFGGASILYIGSGITSTSSTGPNFTGPIQATGDLTITSNALGGIAFQTSMISMLANALTFAGSNEIDVLSTINGTGQVTKNGNGLLLLAGNNSFTGPMAITSGIVKLKTGIALGPNGATTVSGTGRIQLEGPITVSEALIVNGGGTPTIATTAGMNQWTGAITLLTDASVANTTFPTLTISGPISGTGKLAVSGNDVALNAVNGFSGGVSLAAATNLHALKPTALGTGLVTVASDATVRLEATGVYPNAFTLSGKGMGTTGAVFTTQANTVIGGAITLNADSSIRVETGLLTTTGPISGAGGLEKTGDAMLTLQGACSYAGATLVTAGTLKVSGTLPPATALTLADAAAKVDLANVAQTVGSLAGSGTVTLGSATLTAGDATDRSFSGVVEGTGGLVLAGTGTKTFTGISTFTGAATVSAGTVHLAGGFWSSSDVVVNGGILGLSNDANVKSITANGGTVAPGFAFPRDSSAGALTLGAATTFTVDLSDPTAAQFSRLLTPTATLANATLTITASAPPAIGSTFAIIVHKTSGAISGTFKNLPEGAHLDAAGARFAITYVGGTGHDVILTAVAPLEAGAPDDAGTADAGTDADVPDAETPDAETPDAETPDAETPDATTPGSPDASKPVPNPPPANSKDAGTTSTTDAGASSDPAASDDGGCSLQSRPAPLTSGALAIFGVAAAFLARRRARETEKKKQL